MIAADDGDAGVAVAVAGGVGGAEEQLRQLLVEVDGVKVITVADAALHLAVLQLHVSSGKVQSVDLSDQYSIVIGPLS